MFHAELVLEVFIEVASVDCDVCLVGFRVLDFCAAEAGSAAVG
jgi:hypothetical protein